MLDSLFRSDSKGSSTEEEDALSPEEVQILLDAGLSATWKSAKIKATWGEVPGATKYVVYASYCGKKYKKVKTVKGLTASIRKLNGKKLNRKKSVKLYVVAYAGSKKLGRSISAHVAVASVSDEGRIRANGTGSCVIYDYLQSTTSIGAMHRMGVGECHTCFTGFVYKPVPVIRNFR